jgi:2-phospho-L-lactate/phosphoenolpyruvate guanylyltransferase
MKTHAVIAARGGQTAKSRLHTRLSCVEREALVTAMMMDMLSTLHLIERVTKIWVVTPTPLLAGQAADFGASIIHEPDSGGLNAAFEKARRLIAAREPDANIILLPGDLPLLSTVDVEQVLEKRAPDTLVIAPANTDGGTGALALAALSAMPLAFGANSFAKHVKFATALGLKIETVDALGLSLDIDHPRDIDALLSHGIGGQTGALLNHWRAAA